MTFNEMIPYVSTAIAVGAVVYGYVKNKSASEMIAKFNKGADEALKLQSTIVTTLLAMKEPLEKAVKQLPKTRSKRAPVEVEVDDDLPPSAA